MLAPLIGLLVAAQSSAFDFYARGPYDATVPRPESVLGYSPGAHHTDYLNQERYLQALVAAAPSRVRYRRYGESAEGRPLRILIFSSEKNLANLDKISGNLASLRDGLADEKTIGSTPAVVWINEAIHGNEPASFESGMWLAYTLAASRDSEVEKARDELIVIVNPSYNPDGHERFVNWYNSVATGSGDPDAFEQSEPSVVRGRLNHYRFDLNRDRVAMSQPETQQEVAEYLKWSPQVYVDQHGQVSTYFFPPVAMSVNANVDRKRYNEWADIFGRATGKAFDALGFPYYIGDIFDLYYPGYLDSWTSLSGAIGMTHETDGPKSRVMERSDGSTTTLRGAIEKHFTSALAVIGAASENRAKLMSSYAAFKRRAVSGEHAGKMRFLIAKGSRDQLLRLQNQLELAGIKSSYNSDALTLQGATSGWNHGVQTVTLSPFEALVVPMAQSQGPVARALFEQASDFEPDFVKEQLRRRKLASGEERYPSTDSTEFYDLTAWNLLYAHGLDGWWVEALPRARLVPELPESARPTVEPGTVGWAILPSEESSLRVFALLAGGARIQAATREMKVAGRVFPPGTLLILKDRNRDISDLAERIDRAAMGFQGEIVPLGTSFPDSGRQGPGSETVASVKKPNLAVVFGDSSSTTDFGAVWFLLERVWKLPFTPLHKSALRGDLRRFSCIVFPDGRYDEPSAELKSWISQGGCAVMLGGGWAIGEKLLVKLDPIKLEKDRLPGEIPGSLFLGELDPRSFLSYGFDRKGDGKIHIAVPVSGNRWFKAKPEGGGAVVFSSDEKAVKLLSGWSWPEETEKSLRGAVWLHDEPIGNGRVVWFSEDPTQRAMWPGLNRMLLNAILLGPAG